MEDSTKEAHIQEFSISDQEIWQILGQFSNK